MAPWKEIRKSRLRELRELSEASLDGIKAAERMLGRFQEELKKKLRERPVSLWTGMRDSLKSMFGYEVTDDEDESVTIGQLLVLVAYIAVGIVAAYFFSRVVGRYLLRYIGLHPGTTAALRSMVFYMLCIIFGVAAFHVMHVPMAAFAFVGGAAAIAIGFGGQDIMNNFMSGIILLAEQPIRVGDVVELRGGARRGETHRLAQHCGCRPNRITN